MQEENPYKWTVPLDLTAVLDASGESEESAEFFFKIIDLATDSNSGESPKFKITSKDAFISIERTGSTSFSTASLIQFDVLTKLLPSRTIACSLMRARFGSSIIGDENLVKVASFKTTSATGVQKTVVSFLSVERLFMCKLCSLTISIYIQYIYSKKKTFTLL